MELQTCKKSARNAIRTCSYSSSYPETIKGRTWRQRMDLWTFGFAQVQSQKGKAHGLAATAKLSKARRNAPFPVSVSGVKRSCKPPQGEKRGKREKRERNEKRNEKRNGETGFKRSYDGAPQELVPSGFGALGALFVNEGHCRKEAWRAGTGTLPFHSGSPSQPPRWSSSLTWHSKKVLALFSPFLLLLPSPRVFLGRFFLLSAFIFRPMLLAGLLE